MADSQERTGDDVPDAMKGADQAAAAVEGTATTAVDDTTGAVAALVGMVTGGFAIVASAGFVVGVIVGLAVGRRAAKPAPPRWQVWR